MTHILFITATRIGDAILFSGPLAHLARTHPNAEITVACGPLAAPLFRAAPGVTDIIVMAKRPGGGHWLDLWRRASGRRWDMVVDMRGSLTGWFLRTGERKVNRRTPGADHRHRVIEAGAMLDLDPPPEPQVWIDAAAREEAGRLLPSGAPILALAPAASAPFKEWPADRFAALADALTGPGGALEGARVALFGGPGDQAISQAVSAAVTHAPVTDLTGQLDLVSAAACLQRARLFVGNDSGLMHMAAATGAPVLGLFGPTDERVYGPWGRNARSVRAGGPAHEADRGRLRHAETSLMGGLALEQVRAAAEALIEESQA